MKKALIKHRNNHATFMYIPESESKVVSLRTPLWLPKAAIASLVLLLLGIFISLHMLNSINDKYSKSEDEINSLNLVNSSQRQEIEKLQREALQIQQQLEENAKALEQIKKIVGIKESSDVPLKDDQSAIPASSNTSQINSSSTSQQINLAQTSYTELSRAISAQRELIDSSLVSVKKQVAYLSAKPSIKPVNTKITDSFGYRKNPFTNRGTEFHKGTDFAGETGTPIKATGDGVVIFAGWQSGYGNVVIISHGYGITTLYGHNSKLLVKKGEKVKKEQIISKMGSTGRSTGSHLHYEVRVDGKIVNPANYF